MQNHISVISHPLTNKYNHILAKKVGPQLFALFLLEANPANLNKNKSARRQNAEQETFKKEQADCRRMLLGCSLKRFICPFHFLTYFVYCLHPMSVSNLWLFKYIINNSCYSTWHWFTPTAHTSWTVTSCDCEMTCALHCTRTIELAELWFTAGFN